MIKKIITRIAANIIPALLFIILTYIALYYGGAFLFNKHFDVHILLFLVICFEVSIPWTILTLIFYSILVKGNNSKKLILFEYIIYLIIYLFFYLFKL